MILGYTFCYIFFNGKDWKSCKGEVGQDKSVSCTSQRTHTKYILESKYEITGSNLLNLQGTWNVKLLSRRRNFSQLAYYYQATYIEMPPYKSRADYLL